MMGVMLLSENSILSENKDMCIKLCEINKITGLSQLVVCYRCFLQLIEHCHRFLSVHFL